MDFRIKKATAARIAKVQHIPTYREMLKARGSSVAGRIMLDKEALARSLVYNLLDFYSEEEIIAQTTPQNTRGAVVASVASRTTEAVQSIKKKILRPRNIQPSHGRTWTTLLSVLRTAYTRTASTVTELWQGLSKRLRELWSSIVKHLQR